MHMRQPRIILASASPRRAALLEQIGVEFSIQPADIDESVRDGETAQALVQRLAQAKADAVANNAVDALVIGSDTVVTLDDAIFGKPRDQAHAAAMLQQLSGRTHRVYSAVAIVAGDRQANRVSSSDVTMQPLRPEHISAYWASGEPRDKAGGYAIQGLGAVFVQHLAGSYSGVMGLPLYETARLLIEFGVNVLVV